MGHRNSRGKAPEWVAGTVLLFTATALLAGCSSTTGHTATVPSTTKPGAPATTAPPPSNDQSGIQKVVATWVAAIIDGDPAQLCSVSGQPASGTSPAQPTNPEVCAGAGPQEVVTAWRPKFTPEHMTGHPTVRVSPVPVSGSSASIPARKIEVNGQSLHAVLVSHGFEASATSDIVYTSKVNGSWLVTGFLLPPKG